MSRGAGDGNRTHVSSLGIRGLHRRQQTATHHYNIIHRLARMQSEARVAIDPRLSRCVARHCRATMAERRPVFAPVIACAILARQSARSRKPAIKSSCPRVRLLCCGSLWWRRTAPLPPTLYRAMSCGRCGNSPATGPRMAGTTPGPCSFGSGTGTSSTMLDTPS
jgi:hypothetical protein